MRGKSARHVFLIYYRRFNRTGRVRNEHAEICKGGGLALFVTASYAADLTVDRGETHTLAAAVTYDTVSVSGSLVIPAGTSLTATTLNLGPNAGDEAVVEVQGNTELRLVVSGTVNIGGANGGTGKIFALNDAASASTAVLDISRIVINKRTTPSENGTIDFLEIGKMAVPKIVFWRNEATTPARVRFRNSQIGKNQSSWGTTYFKGPLILEEYEAGSNLIVGNDWMGLWGINGKDDALTIRTHGTVTFDWRRATSDTTSFAAVLNKGIAWENVQKIVLLRDATLRCAVDDALPYGPSFGQVSVEGYLTSGLELQTCTVHVNGFSAAKRGADAFGAAVRGEEGSRLVFGAGNVDGTLSGDIQSTVAVEKVGAGTLTVDGETSCGAFSVTEGTLCVTEPMSVETLVVAADAVLVVDGVALEPSVATRVNGMLQLVNGGQLITRVSCETDAESTGFSSAGILIKDGEGVYRMQNPSTLASEVHVQAGSLVLSADDSSMLTAALGVRVDANATLDLSGLSGGKSVNALTLNMNEASGTLIGASLAESGVIRLLSPDGGLAAGNHPFAFIDVQGLENLANWRIVYEGIEMPKGSVSYDAAKQTFVCTVAAQQITATGSGNALAATEGVQIIDVAADAVYTQATALAGAATFIKTGPGTLTIAATANGFAGNVHVLDGIVSAPASQAFGKGTVSVNGSKTKTVQLVLGSTTESTVYDHDIVITGESDKDHPALFFVTASEGRNKKVTVNGTLTAHADFAIADSKAGNEGSWNNLVTFAGEVHANGKTIFYAPDNVVGWKDRVTAKCIRAISSWGSGAHGSHFFEAPSQIGAVELDFIAMGFGSGGMNGTIVRLVGANNEARRGYLTVRGDQVVPWIEQGNKNLAVKNYQALADTTLTMTGGTVQAWCQMALLDSYDGNGNRTGVASFVLDAGNDDFVQTFANAKWTSSGAITVRNGTLRFEGPASAANVCDLVVDGGALELNSTEMCAMNSVTNITLGAAARLHVGPSAVDPFPAVPVLSLAEDAVLEIAEGIEMTVYSVTRAGQRMAQGAFTGAGGSVGTARPWIRGGGLLRILTGAGFKLIVR